MKLVRLFIAIITLVVSVSVAHAGSRPITINFVNRAADVPGLWDDAVRADFVAAMNIEANNVSHFWRHGHPVVVGSGIKAFNRIVAVEGPIFIGSTQVGGYHGYAGGAYAVIDVGVFITAEGINGPFNAGSHEIAEMLVDPAVNQTSHGVPIEIADPVVWAAYDVTVPSGQTYTVSDFVLPAWFTPRAAGPYDFMNTISAPFHDGPGGY